MPPAVHPFTRTLLWRDLRQPGLEHFRLREDAAGARLTGAVVALVDGAPLRVEYDVECTRTWATRAVRVAAWHGEERRRRRLELVVDAEHRWWRQGGVEVAGVAGCVDVDLGVTPSTNTLPIRRLGLAVGESAEVTAAWVRFPELTVRPLAQRYTRTGERTYRYESGDGAFVANLEVDDRGLVVRYPPGWERVG